MLSRIIISIVLVFPFENSSPDRNLDWIGEGLSEQIVERLQSQPGLTVLTREERLACQEQAGVPVNATVTRATAMKLGWDSGADFIITGRYSGSADDLQVSARIIDLETLSSSPEIKTSGNLEDINTLMNDLSFALLRKFAAAGSVRPSDQTSRPPIPRSAFESYVRGILSSDPDKRLEYLQAAVQLHPQYPAAAFQLGLAYHEERDFWSSSIWLEKVAPESPDYSPARFLLGLNRFFLGDVVKAEAIFQSLPQTYDVLVNLGAAQSQNGDYAAALATWQKAIELDPLSSEAFFNTGYVSFLQGRNEAALRSLGDSLRLRGRDSEALFLTGRLYERLGRAEEAQRATTRAIRLSQRVERWLSQPIPKLDRVRPATSFRKPDEIWTEQRLRRRAKGQNVDSWLERIQTGIDAYQYGEAIRELQMVLRVYPGSAEARALLEEVNARLNRQ